jgi:SAM-dependent methyltransferase
MALSERDSAEVIERYRRYLTQFGRSEQGVGWGRKGRQSERFQVLASRWDLKGKTILDVGCGFGDLLAYLTEQCQIPSRYIGIDVVPDLIEEGYRPTDVDCDIAYICTDFLTWDPENQIDVVLGSGIFNFKLSDGDNYSFIKETVRRSFEIARVGVGFNFLTTRVEYTLSETFHTDPLWILEYALSLSRNVSFRQDYFPFEFSVFIDKRESFDPQIGIFDSFISESKLS